MTLIDYFNQFWREDEEKHFTQAETRLYTYLLYLWNSTGRKEWFECKTSMIEHYADINPMTLTRCRKSLKERGLINFKQGSAKGKYPYYSLLCVKDNVKVSVKDNVKVDVNDMLTHIEYRDKEIDTSIEVSKKVELPSCKVLDDLKGERMDWKAFEDFYNQSLSPQLSKIKGLSEKRRKMVKSAIKNHGKEAIVKVFKFVRNSPFHTGNNDRGWKADFEWIFKPENFNRLLEKSEDNGAPNSQANGQLRINSGAVQDQSIDIYKEVFGYDGPPDKFEEWFNRNPYGG